LDSQAIFLLVYFWTVTCSHINFEGCRTEQSHVGVKVAKCTSTDNVDYSVADLQYASGSLTSDSDLLIADVIVDDDDTDNEEVEQKELCTLDINNETGSE
jgi:hypothetical protein